MEKIQMKIPFDIKYRPQIESGEYKVCDQAGNSARIICWDALNKANPDQCIIALIKEGSDNDEDNKWYDTKGFGALRHNRLFIITPEPELTEFEESLRQIIVSALSGETPNRSGGTMSWAVALSDDDVRKLAPRLLELAKKEICKGCTVGLDQYWKGRKDARKEYEEPITYHYSIYQPPCFYGGVCTNPMRDCINCPMHSSGATTNTTSGTCKKD